MSENKKRIHVQHYYSPESNRVPSVESASNPDGIVQGEIAINVPDEKLFIAKNDKSGVATFSSDEKLTEQLKNTFVVNGDNVKDVDIVSSVNDGTTNEYSEVIITPSVIQLISSTDEINNTTNLTIDNTGVKKNGNEIATEEYVKSLASGGIRFIGIESAIPYPWSEGVELIWEEDPNSEESKEEQLDTWIEENLYGYNHGDLIIVGGSEYILVRKLLSDAPYTYQFYWELLGDTTVVDKRITDEITRATDAESGLSRRIDVIKGSYVPSFKTADVTNEETSSDSEIRITSEYVHSGEFSDVYSQSTIYLGGDDENGRIIELVVDDEDIDGNSQYNNLTISARDGVKVNGSNVITKDNANANGILAVDENGILNKTELSIGSFEIKNDKPYNYTLNITFNEDDYETVISAQYNGGDAVLMNGNYNDFFADNECWFYSFRITSFIENDEDYSDAYSGIDLLVPACYIDKSYDPYYSEFMGEELHPLTFNGNIATFRDIELSLLDDVGFNYSLFDLPSHGTITISTPYSLKHTSKLFLNGEPIPTKNTLNSYVEKYGKTINIKKPNDDIFGDIFYDENLDYRYSPYIKHNDVGTSIGTNGYINNTYTFSNEVTINESSVKLHSSFTDPDDITTGHSVMLNPLGFTYDDKQIATVDQIPTDYAKKSDIPTDYVKSSHTDNSGLGNLARIYYTNDESYDENPVINLVNSNDTYCSKIRVEDKHIILNVENGDSSNVCSSVEISTNGVTISGGVDNGESFEETVVNINNDGVIVDNKVTATAFYESSDERLKIFKSDIDVDLDKLAELRKSYFTFVEDPGTNHIGISAQEINKLYPEIVTEGSDGFLKVDYAKLSVVALKAVDMLNAKNKELEERLSKIEKALNL